MNGLPCHENAKQSFRAGIEGSLGWNIWNNLHFDLNGSYSCNKVLSNTFGKSNHILTPSVTLDSDLSWKADNWRVGTNVNYRSSMYIDMENNYSIPELFTLNVYGSMSFKNVELSVRVNNVTNRTNYCTGMLGADNQILYIKNASINLNGSILVYF